MTGERDEDKGSSALELRVENMKLSNGILLGSFPLKIAKFIEIISRFQVERYNNNQIAAICLQFTLKTFAKLI
jgi:hypothetical protein